VLLAELVEGDGVVVDVVALHVADHWVALFVDHRGPGVDAVDVAAARWSG